MCAGFREYSRDNSLDMSLEIIEGNAYKLRSLIGQMANHKSHDRQVPNAWQKYFETIWDKNNVSDGTGRIPDDDLGADPPSEPVAPESI
eukprot:4975825-Pyramimonas_sp.AAC.1